MCTHDCVCVGACAHMLEKDGAYPQMSCSWVPSTSFETRSSIGLELINLVRLTGQRDPGILLSLSSQQWGITYMYPWSLFLYVCRRLNVALHVCKTSTLSNELSFQLKNEYILKNHYFFLLCFGEYILFTCSKVSVVLGKTCYMKVCVYERPL